MTAPTDQLLRPHDYPGRLFIVEGIDGSGKSTQIRLLQTWLESQGYSVFFTEWNSADLIKATTKRAKKKGALTPPPSACCTPPTSRIAWSPTSSPRSKPG